MPDLLRQLIDFVEAKPFHSVAALIAAILYLRMMTSGPRYY